MRTVGGDQYCPAGLTACNVGAGINGYEVSKCPNYRHVAPCL